MEYLRGRIPIGVDPTMIAQDAQIGPDAARRALHDAGKLFSGCFDNLSRIRPTASKLLQETVEDRWP
jgi:hypothetical protein